MAMLLVLTLLSSGGAAAELPLAPLSAFAPFVAPVAASSSVAGSAAAAARSSAAYRDAVRGNWTSCAVTDDGDDTCQVPLNAAPVADKCSVVTSCCTLGNGGTVLFNYYNLHFCVFPRALRWLSAILLFLWLCVVFSLLATTADNYFVTQLETLSAELKLSPTVAGITLLALGNSAPDVFSDLAAVKGAGDFDLALGELMGAAMFLTTIVLSAVIIVSTGGVCPKKKDDADEEGDDDETLTLAEQLAIARTAATAVAAGDGSPLGSGTPPSDGSSPETAFTTRDGGGAPRITPSVFFKSMLIGTSSCDVDAVPFARDVGAFLIALTAILLMISIPDPDGGHSVTLIEAIILILVYVGYVVIVVAADYIPMDAIKAKLGCGPKFTQRGGDIHRMASMFGGGSMSTALIGAGGGDEEVGSTVELVSSDSLGSLNAEEEEEEEVDLTVVGVEWDSDANVFEKIIFIIEFPFSVLRAISIPSADRRWDWRHRLLAAISPIGCVMIVFLDFSPNWNLNPASGQATPWNGFAQPISAATGHTPIFIIPLALAIVASLVIFFLTNNRAPPRWYMVFVLIGFVSTIAWLDMIGNECVAVLEVLGVVTGITSTPGGSAILGITLLAWANSIGDFVADTSVARAGRPKMGVASVFGSPLLTACLGLGLASVIATIGSPGHRVKAELSDEIIVSFIFLGISLFSSLVVIPLFKFKIPRFYSFYLMVVYCGYMLFSGLVVADVLHILPSGN